MKYVYWDSNCFIEYLKGTEKSSSLSGVLDQASKGLLTIVTSALTLIEVFHLGEYQPIPDTQTK